MAISSFKFVSPGVFINEIDNSAIPAAADVIGPVVIGRATRGLAMQPITVESYSDFVEMFGDTVPGFGGGDISRDGNFQSPMYGTYAAKAFLDANVAPLTYIRLLGQETTNGNSNASSTPAAAAGWRTEQAISNTPSANGGAYGLWLFTSGGNAQANLGTGSLAAVWYLNAATDIYLSGTVYGGSVTDAQGGEDMATTGANNVVIGTDSDSLFTLVISGAGASEKVRFGFDDTSANWIRNKFNTNPQLVSGATFYSGESAKSYWLGETYEQELRDRGFTSGSLGCMMAISNATTTGPWKMHPQASREGRSGWFIGQDLGAAASFLINEKQKLFRLIGRGHGEWLHKNCKVSISNVRRSTTTVSDYGTFSLLIRSIHDTDNSVQVIERFDSLNLDPTSPNYIARVIGDKYTSWDENGRQLKTYGEYDNQSKFVYVEMNNDVDAGATDATLLPFGYFGPPRFRSVFNLNATGACNAEISGPDETPAAATATLTVADGDDSTSDQFTEGEYVKMIATDGTVGIFILSDASETGAVASGTVLGASSDLGTGVPAAALLAAGTCIAVTCNLNTNSQAVVLNEFRDTIASSNSPLKDKITAAAYVAASDGAQTMTFTQATLGANGNTTITTNISQISKTNFAGGVASDLGRFKGDGGNMTRFFVTGGAGIVNSGSSPPTSYNAIYLSGGEGISTGGYSSCTGSLVFPSVRLRVSASDGGLSDVTDAYYGMQTTRTTTTTTGDKSIADFHRLLYSGYTAGGGQNATNRFATTGVDDYSYVFSLDDIVLKTAGGTDYLYISGSRRGEMAGNLGSASYTELLNASIDKFTAPFWGGFDGFNIMKPDPLYNKGMASTSTEDNDHSYHTWKRAMDTVADPEFLNMNLLATPGLTLDGLTTHAVRVCEERADALALIDLPNVYVPAHESYYSNKANRLASTPTNAANSLRDRIIDSSYGATFYPWVQTRDDATGAMLWIPPSVAMMGVLASSEAASDIWFAPAGFNRGGLSEGAAGIPVVGVTQRLTSKERDTLYEANINPIASFPSTGIVVFGQKTLQERQSALDRINVRRLVIYLKKQISILSTQILFEQNVQATWNRFIALVEPFLANVKIGYGITDYKLILDETTTTADLIDQNVLYAKIMIKPARAIEYIAIDFVIMSTGASFDD